MNNKELLNLLDKARHYHNILCDEKEAIRICNKILKEYPENRDAMLIKAGALNLINREKESFQLITQIMKKWPRNWEAYYLMGLLLFNTNERMAIKNFKISIELEKNFNNIIALSQLLYFLEDENYKKYLKEARIINILRYKNYMNNFWEWEIC
jgi:tetratricopeptide (TPR) repeat protein